MHTPSLRAARRPFVAGLTLLMVVGTIVPMAAQEPGPSPSPRASQAVGAAAASAPPAAMSFAPIDLEMPLAGPGVLPTDPAAVQLIEAVRTPEYGPETRLATAAVLAVAGVAVVDEGSLEPLVPIDGQSSGLRFLDWQLHALALEAWAGNGIDRDGARRGRARP